jgi:hypothetical protein
MKNLLLCILVGLALQSSFAQTEIWHQPAMYPKFILEDGLGNAYLARTYGAPDSLNTLRKVNAQGATVWETHLTTSYFTMHYSGSGIYICPFNWGSLSENRIFYYDTSGALAWTYTMPFTGYGDGGLGQTDIHGNLVFAYGTPPAVQPASVKLFKLNPQGEKILDVTVPQFNFPNMSSGPSFNGPVPNASGNIWVVISGESDFSQQRGIRSTENGTAYQDAILFDGQLGTVITRVNLFKGTIFIHTDDGKGNGRQYDTDGPPFQHLKAVGDNLLAWGTWHSINATIKKNAAVRQEEKSKWQFVMASPSGQATVNGFAGSGKEQTSDPQGHKVTTDEGDNAMSDVFIGNQNEIFLYGTIAKGTSQKANFHVEEVLTRFDPVAKRLVWKLSNPQPPGSYTTVNFYQSMQKFLRGVVVNTCAQTLQVIDKSGRTGTQNLSFTACTWLSPNGEPSMSLQGPNFEQGKIYLPTGDGFSKFDVNSFLAHMAYKKPALDGDGLLPYTNRLDQNYPNPFNPSTSIQFELKSDAVVTIKIYNIIGEEVSTLADRKAMSEGVNELEFNAANLPSGVYFYRILAVKPGENSPMFSATRKMMFMK